MAGLRGVLGWLCPVFVWQRHVCPHTLETRIFEYRRLPANTRDETTKPTEPHHAIQM